MPKVTGFNLPPEFFCDWQWTFGSNVAPDVVRERAHFKLPKMRGRDRPDMGFCVEYRRRWWWQVGMMFAHIWRLWSEVPEGGTVRQCRQYYWEAGASWGMMGPNYAINEHYVFLYWYGMLDASLNPANWKDNVPAAFENYTWLDARKGQYKAECGVG